MDAMDRGNKQGSRNYMYNMHIKLVTRSHTSHTTNRLTQHNHLVNRAI